MRTYFRALILGIAALVALTAAAQSPYTLIVQGTVAGCTPFQQVTVATTGNTQPLVSHTLEVFPLNCFYDTVIDVFSPTASVMVSTMCGGVLISASDGVTFNAIGDTAVITIDLVCGSTIDCQGIPGGSALPGTPCNDGDPNTINDTWTPLCQCVGTVLPCHAEMTVNVLGPWTVSFANASSGAAPLTWQWSMPDGSTTGTTNPTYVFTAPGTYGACISINAGNGCTSFDCDTIYVDSTGYISTLPIYYDCLGVPNGSEVPGTPCDDNDPLTYYDTWDGTCNCVGYSMQGQVLITGTIAPCPAPFTPVQIMSASVLPFVDTLIYSGANCDYSLLVDVITTTGWFYVQTSCDSGQTWVIDSLGYSLAAGVDTLLIDLYCGGGLTDCAGIPGGPNLPGTPCQIPGTVLFGEWDANCVCDTTTLSVYDCTGILNGPNMPGTACTDTIGGVLVPGTWQANCMCVTNTLNDCLGIFNGPNMPGTPCNDGDTLTVQDTWSPTCQCVGVPVNYYDCLQIVNGPNLPGTPCNDNNPATIGDTWDANCNCVGSVPQPCNADFWVLQAYTIDSVTNLPVPTPNELWIWNLSSGGTGAYTFLWNFGDGTSSTDPFPTHVYASGGPYILCLTINDSAGCTSTHCDSVSVDANGMYTGIMGAGNDRQNGFTINVRDPLATGITERPTVLGELALWPNPVQDLLNIALVSDLQGAVSVEVVDISGRVVRSERHVLGGGRTQFTVPTNDLAPGLHVLRISNGTSSINQRFVRSE